MKSIRVVTIAVILLLGQFGAQGRTRQLTVKLRGVYDSKITLSPFNGIHFAIPLSAVTEVKSGEITRFSVPDSLLPGEFLLRFDYRQNASDSPYPSEVQLYLNREDIEVEAHPLYLSNEDSLILKGDLENGAWRTFMKQSSVRRQQMSLLQQMLSLYDKPNSAEWKKALKAYEKRRRNYNGWIDSLARAQNGMYVSHLYVFQKMQAENWKVKSDERLALVARQWFDWFDFSDTTVLRSRQMNELMNGYMGLYGMRATTVELRDSLFTQAGKLACSLASVGHPKVYGWMVDYFFNGYETYNIASGLNMLETHLNNPRCLTSKKLAIAKRLEGMKVMRAGVKVKNIMAHNYDDKEVQIDMNSCRKDFRLLLFYDSECGHCLEMLGALEKWYSVPENRIWLDVVSISLDKTREAWEPAFVNNSFPWTDLYAPGGINSIAASDYFVLSAPSLFLVDKNGNLLGMPGSVDELDRMIKGQ